MTKAKELLLPSEALQLFLDGRELAKYCEAQISSPFHARATVGFTVATMCFPDLNEEEFISVMRTTFKSVCRLSEQLADDDASREAD